MSAAVDIIVLGNRVLKKFGFQSVEYFGPSKNYVFQCVDTQGKKYVFKMFHIHENRREEDLKKAWREIAFHHYAGSKLRLPSMLACEYSSGELGVHLLTEFKTMKALTAANLTAGRVNELIEKFFWLHGIRVSSLNPGLRARIGEEDLKKNHWVTDEATLLLEEGLIQASTFRKMERICLKMRDSPLASKNRKGLVHGDARIQNTYIDENDKLQLRDFEHANINSPLLDAASFYYSIYDHPLREPFLEAFKKRYTKEHPDVSSAAFDEAFQFFVVHRLMAWLTFNTRFTKDVGAKTARKRIDQSIRLLEDFLGTTP
ncbi:phosphotransferase [Candidatus Micrarchaeota archaeon]|nr:phosphotransferase [Candidatus Micrarchaeota archaeon]